MAKVIELSRVHLSTAEFARMHGYKKRTVALWCRQGRIPSDRAPGAKTHYRIPLDTPMWIAKGREQEPDGHR